MNPQEQQQIVDAVNKITAPAQLALHGPDGSANWSLVESYLLRTRQTISLESLTAAVNAMANQLIWITLPPKLKREQLAKAGVHENKLNNQKSAADTEKEEAENVRVAIQKGVEKRSEAEIDELIRGYQCIENGKYMYGKTDTVRANLRKIEVKKLDGTRDSVATLAAVIAALAELRRFAERGQRVR